MVLSLLIKVYQIELSYWHLIKSEPVKVNENFFCDRLKTALLFVFVRGWGLDRKMYIDEIAGNSWNSFSLLFLDKDGCLWLLKYVR
ncbi:unknown protein [Desulfotalea psychrophila LSv54]|uniref:Uncharacterized protein n=1 Tax=Desulfotalea psychrophila (strain LSv54 / DSM 12343) TaxID=177439 RepID=Q6AJY1_DESPS|nr:unknown protein [Desulfotalea psychrophila LSv54]